MHCNAPVVSSSKHAQTVKSYRLSIKRKEKEECGMIGWGHAKGRHREGVCMF